MVLLGDAGKIKLCQVCKLMGYIRYVHVPTSSAVCFVSYAISIELHFLTFVWIAFTLSM